MKFHRHILDLNGSAETDRIVAFIRHQMARFKREGAVVGLSGGVDSALAASLCVRALGPERVFTLVLPEGESNPLSREYALKEAGRLGVKVEVIDITPVLEAFGTYYIYFDDMRAWTDLYAAENRDPDDMADVW